MRRCSRLDCAATALTACFHPFAVLSCALLGSHHVHQQGPEGERLCHCVPYVQRSSVVKIDGFFFPPSDAVVLGADV